MKISVTILAETLYKISMAKWLSRLIKWWEHLLKSQEAIKRESQRSSHSREAAVFHTLLEVAEAEKDQLKSKILKITQ